MSQRQAATACHRLMLTFMTTARCSVSEHTSRYTISRRLCKLMAGEIRALAIRGDLVDISFELDLVRNEVILLV